MSKHLMSEDAGPDKMDSFPEIEDVIKTEVDSCPTPEEDNGEDSIDITYIIPDIKPVILEKRGCKRSKEDSEPVASKSLKKKKPAEGEKEANADEDRTRPEEEVVKEERPKTRFNCDYGDTSIWVDDIDESDEYVIPELPSEFNLGKEAEKRLKEITIPVKNPVRVENEEGGAEAVYDPVSSDDDEIWEAPSDCTWDCIHAKQNEVLKEAVHQLSRRNTLLEDFIQVEFEGKFQKFVKKRQILLNTGYGEAKKETSGKRSKRSDDVVALLRLIKGSEDSKEKERHRHRSRTTESGTASSSSHRKNENISSSSSDVEILKIKSRKKETSKPQPIYPQHKVSSIADEVFDPLTDIPKVIAPVPVPSLSTIKTIIAKRSLPSSSLETESSNEEDHNINGLTLPQLLKWQDLKKQRSLVICPVCNETLEMKNIRDHLMIIHKSIKLTCVVENCLMEFKTRGLFKKHLVKEHSWTEEVYLEVIKTLEEPVLQWLDETSSKVVSITIDNVIRRKKLQAYMEEAKKRTEERIETLSKSVSEAVPIPIRPVTFQPPTVKEVSAPAIKPVSHRAPTKLVKKLLRMSEMPLKPPLNFDDEPSDEDDDTTGLTLSQLLKWQDTGKSRKLTVCQICNVTLKLKNLRDHLLVVHKNIKLTCPFFCRLEFKTRSFLKKHMFRMHLLNRNIQDVYSEQIKALERPVLDWLNQKCDKYQITTMNNAIKRTRKQLTKEKEKAKKRNPPQGPPPQSIWALPPRPTPIFFPKSPPHPSTPIYLPSQTEARFLPEYPPRHP